MKAILAGVVAAATLLAAGASADAQAVRVVVKPGYPYHHNGVQYRYMSGGRYYNARVRVCKVNHHHRRVCTWRYR
jgi:hypothetical protein